MIPKRRIPEPFLGTRRELPSKRAAAALRPNRGSGASEIGLVPAYAVAAEEAAWTSPAGASRRGRLQGSGATSPYVGQTVTTSGVVTKVNNTLAQFETMKRYRVVAEEWALGEALFRAWIHL